MVPWLFHRPRTYVESFTGRRLSRYGHIYGVEIKRQEQNKNALLHISFVRAIHRTSHQGHPGRAARSKEHGRNTSETWQCLFAKTKSAWTTQGWSNAVQVEPEHLLLGIMSISNASLFFGHSVTASSWDAVKREVQSALAPGKHRTPASPHQKDLDFSPRSKKLFEAAHTVLLRCAVREVDCYASVHLHLTVSSQHLSNAACWHGRNQNEAE